MVGPVRVDSSRLKSRPWRRLAFGLLGPCATLLACLCARPIQGAQGAPPSSSPTAHRQGPATPKPSADLLPEGSDPERFRAQLSQYEHLLWKADEAAKHKSRLQKSLEEAKSAHRQRPFVDEFVHQRQIETLQSQLHLTIDEHKRLAREKGQFLAALRENAATYRNSFERIRAGLERSLQRNNLDKDVAGRIQAQLAEINHYIAMLDDFVADSSHPDEILTRPFGDLSPPIPPPGGLPPAPVPSRPWAVIGMIRRLEREQESLLKRWQQNEASLRNLRAMLPASDSLEEARSAEASSSDRGAAAIPAPLLRPEAFMAGVRMVGSSSQPAPDK